MYHNAKLTPDAWMHLLAYGLESELKDNYCHRILYGMLHEYLHKKIIRRKRNQSVL